MGGSDRERSERERHQLKPPPSRGRLPAVRSLPDCADGMTKLIFDKETHRIIGGAIVGTNGGEPLGEIGLAIEMGCDAEDIALTIHAHPTLHESVGLAAEIYEGSITDLPNLESQEEVILLV